MAGRSRSAESPPLIDATEGSECGLGSAERPRLEELFRNHAGWLKNTLRRRFGRDDAEDLSQEAFYRARPYLDRDLASPRPLLLRIATNAAFERRTLDGRHAPDAGGGPGHWSDGGCLPGGQFDQVLLKQLIADLSPKLRDVFILSRFEGLTYPEIAQRCGISIKTVEWRMTKALAICASRLRD